MPEINESSQRFQITATTLGGYRATQTIVVYKRERTMTLSVSPYPVLENDSFVLSITDADKPLPNATVWFNDQKFFTDINGTITLTAPDVLVNTTYGILAVKSGYPSASSQITVRENKKGQQLMEVVAPLLVSPGENDVKISVLSLYGGVYDATISLFYNGTQQASYQTNAGGNTFISAPHSTVEDSFTLHVEKQGYTTYTGEQSYTMYLFEQDLTSDLLLSLYPSEVFEGDSVTAEVVDDVTVAVQKVSIWRGETILSGKTDNQGILSFRAPSVFMDREFYLYAIKAGYNYAGTTLTVRNKPEGGKPLHLVFNTTVYETDEFLLTVTDDSSQPLNDVQVIFAEQTYHTDETGTLTLTAPEVDTNSFYSLQANKYSYLPATSMIEVQPRDQQNTTPSSILYISAPPRIIENDRFTVTVRNEQGRGIADVYVGFHTTHGFTDSKGSVSFIAPATEWDTSEQITASKNGYTSTTSEITIANSGGFSYLFLLIILSGILIIGVIYYFRTRHQF